MSQGVRTTDCKKENLSAAEAGKANKLHNQLNNNSHGGGWSADLTTGKCRCTSTLPTACELETLTKTHNGKRQHSQLPRPGPSAAGAPPAPAPQRACPSELTSVGVVHVPIIDQHFVKEDDAPIAGERLLGEPRRERHQRRCHKPWNRGHVFAGKWSGPVPRGGLTALFCL